MKSTVQSRGSQQGFIKALLLALLVLAAAAGAWLMFDDRAADDLRRAAEIRALEAIGEAATERLTSVTAEGEGTHGSAVDLINRPIEVRQVADNVYYATGVGNVFMITTDEGNVIFDTGLVLQAATQLRVLKEEVSDGPVTHVVLSHSHADHVGGTRLWAEPDTEIIAHEEFEEEQRYLTELEPYFYGRNRTLFPWMPADRPELGLLAYGGIEPTRTVKDAEVYSFTLGGTEFQVIGSPGAEGADNIVLWLPQQKILLTGDFFGPQFPQFPNVFTMRGEKVRKPMEYVGSLDQLIALEPAIVAPSHLNPTEGAEQIRADMQRIRDAVQYVHDGVIAGMNVGKSVYDLMKEIQLPPELYLVQNHGKVSWAVKSIWEYYATWFHFDSTTELYPVPAREVYADLAEVAGAEALLALAGNYLQQAEPVKTLHIVEVILAKEPANGGALQLRREALSELKLRAEAGERNDYEIYWLDARLIDTDLRLGALP